MPEDSKPDTPWYENDAFWAAIDRWYYGDDSLWKLAPDQVSGMLELTGLSAPAKVLDLCCGPGRHSLELARRGFTVTGVDRTARYLNTARERAQAESLDVEWIECDMRSFIDPDRFDIAASFFNSFGYFRNENEHLAVLENLFESLRPKGKLVLDVMSRDVLAEAFQDRDWLERDGDVLLMQHTIDDDLKWITTHYTMIEDGQRRELEYSVRLFSERELTSLCRRAGFRRVKCFGDLDGNPYDENAERLVLIASK